MCKFIPFFLILTILTSIVFAAPVSETLVITDPTDIEFIDEHEDALSKLEKLAANRRNWEARRVDAAARVAIIDAAITVHGTKIRRGLVRYKPALDGNLPIMLTDSNLDRSVVDELTIRWNMTAETYRNAP